MIYWLSPGDEITRIVGDWDKFAIQNNGMDVLADAVLDRSLWDFVQGVPTRQFLSELFLACRQTEHLLTLPYRCDGNGEERLFAMRLIPETRGVLRLEHVLVRCRPALAGTLPKAVSVERFRQCSICLSCHTGLHWMSPGRVMQKPGNFGTYVICPACRAAMGLPRVPALEGMVIA